MSREILVAMSEAEVVVKCHAAKVGVSVIERIPAGGVRLVCMSASGAETMRKTFKAHIIEGSVVREKLRPDRPFW
jgi:hypothetical protein